MSRRNRVYVFISWILFLLFSFYFISEVFKFHKYSLDWFLAIVASLIGFSTVARIHLSTKIISYLFIFVLIFTSLIHLWSFYFIGESVNLQVLNHFGIQEETTAAASAYTVLIWMTVFFTLTFINLFYAHRNLAIKKKSYQWILIILFFSPLWSPQIKGFADLIYQINQSRFTKSDFSYFNKKDRLVESSQTSNTNLPNVIIIYLEGLEQTYDVILNGTLTPQLQKLSKTGIHFTNIHQYPGTGWTIAGLFSSHCAIPFIFAGEVNESATLIDEGTADLKCLSDILHNHNYKNIFMGGADLKFAGKGAFLRRHRYEAYGLEELKPKLPESTPVNGWGLYDEHLIELAKNKIQELKNNKDPFNLTLLTLDTHPPSGFSSPSCVSQFPKLKDSPLAIQCTDYLIGNYIGWLEKELKDLKRPTFVFLVSDHLTMQTDLTPVLNEVKNNRKLRFTVLEIHKNSKLEAKEVSSEGTHFDIGPTILDFLQIKLIGNFRFGQSLLSSSAGYLAEHKVKKEDFKRIRTDEILENLKLNLTQGLLLNQDGGVFIPQFKNSITTPKTNWRMLFSKEGLVEQIYNRSSDSEKEEVIYFGRYQLLYFKDCPEFKNLPCYKVKNSNNKILKSFEASSVSLSLQELLKEI